MLSGRKDHSISYEEIVISALDFGKTPFTKTQLGLHMAQLAFEPAYRMAKMIKEPFNEAVAKGLIEKTSRRYRITSKAKLFYYYLRASRKRELKANEGIP